MSEEKVISGGNVEAMVDSFARRLETLLAQQIEISADMTELRKEFTGEGLDDFQGLKSFVKARILDAEDGGTRFDDLLAKRTMGCRYGEILARAAPEQKQEAA